MSRRTTAVHPDAAENGGDGAVRAAGSSGAVPPNPPNGELDGLNVLVVDDTEGNRYTVSRLLRGAGMRVREAETAAEALRQLRESVPDLVVLDINLPDGSGHDICRAIKEDPSTAAVPVMHVSASFVTDADRAYGLEHGADAYLTHPLDPGVFVATARALLRAEGERGRLYKVEHQARRAAERAAARATLLQDLTAALARTMTAAEVSEVVVTRAFAALGALAGLLTVTTADGTELELFGTASLPGEAAQPWRSFTAPVSTPTADAMRTVRAVALGTYEEIGAAYPRLQRDVFPLLADQPRSLYATPLVVDRGPGERVLGAILFLWATESAADAATVALVTAVADQCALALERARLYEAERAARAAAETARAEAEKANRAKAEFLAVMSHELRTPLNAIGGYAELVELGVYGPVTPEQLGALARLRRSQEHLLGLINSVLNFAKLEAGRIEYQVEPTMVNDAVRSVDALIAPLAAARGLELDSGACGAVVVARADAEKLRQILLNLFSNAIKFTPPGGRVTVRCAVVDGEEGDRHVAVRVADTGRGISPDELEHVFDPFVQVGRKLSSSDGGTGLGLAISRDLARGMGGELTAESEVGVGSTFILTLPTA
ncbi:MAG: ATP-binding response regulator [Gemmatimonadaceae bacterium]